LKTLFLAWQAPTDHQWLPIGRLTFGGGCYRFVYLQGASKAERLHGFRPLLSFPSLSEVYESDELFPIFANRLPSRSRSDYGDFVRWLNAPQDEDDPIALLARSGGRRVTDNFEVFPCPAPDENGQYHIHFFAHRLRQLPAAAIERIGSLQPGDRLLLMHDFQNPYDPSALALRTNGQREGDRHIVGYCPRYLLADAFEVLTRCPGLPEVAVEQVNPPPAPLQLRLLCNLTTCWPEDFRPCSNPEYQPLVATAMSQA